MARNMMPARKCRGGIRRDYNADQWSKVDIMAPPGGVLRAQMLEPTRTTQVLKAVSIHQSKPGTYIVDFGQNFYGIARLRASAPAGTVVKMRQAYSLNPDGSMRSQDNRTALATDTYIFKGVRRGNLEPAVSRARFPAH